MVQPREYQMQRAAGHPSRVSLEKKRRPREDEEPVSEETAVRVRRVKRRLRGARTGVDEVGVGAGETEGEVHARRTETGGQDERHDG